MMILVLPLAIDRISVRAIAKRRAFALDRLQQDTPHGFVDTLPLRLRKGFAYLFGMHFGSVEDLRGIQVTDARNQFLIEQRRFDLAFNPSESIDEIAGSDRQCIGSKRIRTEMFLALLTECLRL